MARNDRKTEFILLWISQARKEIFTFWAIIFVPIKVWSCSAPQNDGLNFSFVKDICSCQKKWPEVVEKWQFCIYFWSKSFIENNVDISSFFCWKYQIVVKLMSRSKYLPIQSLSLKCKANGTESSRLILPKKTHFEIVYEWLLTVFGSFRQLFGNLMSSTLWDSWDT